jgi:molecular chaperone DnaK (HSP70)
MSLTAGKITMSIECFMEDKDVKCEVVRDDMESLAASLLARVDTTANRLISSLALQNISLDDFSAVEVVGGSTRIASVRTRLVSLFQKELSTTLNIDEAVVRGASLQAAISSPSFRVREFVVIDKTQYAIDLYWKAAATDENSNAPIYPENSATHLSKMLTFYRDSPFEIEAKYGNPATVPDREETIAKFQIDGITAGADGKAQKIKVKLRIDEFGVFSCESAQLVEKIADSESELQTAEQTGETSEAKKAGDAPKDGAETPKEPAKEADKADVDAKKKRAAHKTIDLRVQTTRPRQLSQEALNALVEAEAQFQALDRQEVDRTNAKNALEEYIYDMRIKVETFAEYFDKTSSDKLKAKLDEIQNWLYDEGEDQPRAEYATRLQSMTDISGPALARSKEFEKLPEAENSIRQAIVHLRKITEEYAAGSDKYSHIEAAEMAKVAAMVAETEAFVDSGLAAQARTEKFKPLTVTAAILGEKKAALEKTCNPIVKKSKPLPKIEKEQPPVDPAPATSEPAATGDPKQQESNPAKPTDLD